MHQDAHPGGGEGEVGGDGGGGVQPGSEDRGLPRSLAARGVVSGGGSVARPQEPASA